MSKSNDGKQVSVIGLGNMGTIGAGAPARPSASRRSRMDSPAEEPMAEAEMAEDMDREESRNQQAQAPPPPPAGLLPKSDPVLAAPKPPVVPPAAAPPKPKPPPRSRPR